MQCSSSPTEQHTQEKHHLLLAAIIVSEQDGLSAELQATLNNVSCWSDAVVLISKTSTDGASSLQDSTATKPFVCGLDSDGFAKQYMLFTTSRHGIKFNGSVASARNAALAFAAQQGMQWALLLHEGESVVSTDTNAHNAGALLHTKANVVHCYHPEQAPNTEVCSRKNRCE
jgi:hypothetical protein